MAAGGPRGQGPILPILGGWTPPLVITACFAALMAWTWRKWPHVTIDFGRELYTPWRLSEGAVLYRDIAYFNGPFSPYFNAVLFHSFGVSLTTLIVANSLIFAFLLFILYRWISDVADRLTATAVCLLMLCAFGFAQLDLAGNYNYICPYSHEMTHAIVLGLLMLRFSAPGAAPRRGVIGTRLTQPHSRDLEWSAAGLCWGLLFLGKPEFFLAATAAAVVALGGPVCLGVMRRKHGLAHLLIFLGAGLAPVLLFTSALATQMPFMEAVRGVLGGWPWLLEGEVTRQSFYVRSSGLDQPLAHLMLMAKATLSVALAIGFAVLIDRWRASVKNQPRPTGNIWGIAAVACLITAMFLQEKGLFFLLQGRALLPLAVLLCVALLTAAWRNRNHSGEFFRLGGLAVWSVFALVLLAKLMLIPRVGHYGFVLAMPAAILAATCLLAFLPPWLERAYGGGRIFRVAVLCLLAVDAASYLFVSADYYQQKSVAVGSGGDTILAESADAGPLGPAVQQTLKEIQTQFPAGATFAVLPEGVTLNYLARRSNPTGHINFMPPEIIMFGEDNMVEAFRRRPPDYLVLLHKNTSEYGVGLFGSPGYGDKLMKWLRTQYHTLKVIGHRPLISDKFGVEILKRNST